MLTKSRHSEQLFPVRVVVVRLYSPMCSQKFSSRRKYDFDNRIVASFGITAKVFPISNNYNNII